MKNNAFGVIGPNPSFFDMCSSAIILAKGENRYEL